MSDTEQARRIADAAFWERGAKENYMKVIACHEDPEVWERTGKQNVDDTMVFIGDGSEMTILDWGCGAGRVTKHLSPRFRHVIAFDWSQSMLNLVRALDLPNVMTTVNTNGIKGIDAVFSILVFFHIRKADLPDVFRSVRMMLRQGGHFVFQLPIHSVGADRMIEHPGSVATWTPEEFEELLSSAGFEVKVSYDNPNAYNPPDDFGVNHFRLHYAVAK